MRITDFSRQSQELIGMCAVGLCVVRVYTRMDHFGHFESFVNCELLPFERCRHNENKETYYYMSVFVVAAEAVVVINVSILWARDASRRTRYS